MMGGKKGKAMITFLKRTKEEKYDRIDEISLTFSRDKETERTVLLWHPMNIEFGERCYEKNQQ